MREIRKGLDSPEVNRVASDAVWTQAVKTKLCEIGRDEFRYKVGASNVPRANCDYGEWLYDVTWLEYENGGPLFDAHLVAECEWGNFGHIGEDFDKLLLARTGVRLMIFGGVDEPGSKEIAEQLAKRIRAFKGSRAEDAWLLASWGKCDNSDKGWRFSYFTIGGNTAIPLPPLSGG